MRRPQTLTVAPLYPRLAYLLSVVPPSSFPSVTALREVAARLTEEGAAKAAGVTRHLLRCLLSAKFPPKRDLRAWMVEHWQIPLDGWPPEPPGYLRELAAEAAVAHSATVLQLVPGGKAAELEPVEEKVRANAPPVPAPEQLEREAVDALRKLIGSTRVRAATRATASKILLEYTKGKRSAEQSEDGVDPVLKPWLRKVPDREG